MYQRDFRTAAGLQRVIAIERNDMASPIRAPTPLYCFRGERSLTFFFFEDAEEVRVFFVVVVPGAPPSCRASVLVWRVPRALRMRCSDRSRWSRVVVASAVI